MYLQAPSVFSSGKWLQSEYIDGFLLLPGLSFNPLMAAQGFML
jgi:hypothetical protein